MLARQPLVAEVAADLVDAVEAADHQPLQVQLGRDPHVEVEVERVVVGLERLRRRAADDPVQHRRLHLEEAARVEEAADAAHDRAPLAEHLAHLGVDHQVDVALAVADLRVRQAVKFLGQRPRRLGQDPHALGHDGQLARLHDRRAADRADEVAPLRLLPERERRLAEQILADLDLDLTGAVEELHEGHLPERPEVHDASGHREVVVGEQRRARLSVVPVAAAAAAWRRRTSPRSRPPCASARSRSHMDFHQGRGFPRPFFGVLQSALVRRPFLSTRCQQPTVG